jgi:hypothetical protein
MTNRKYIGKLLKCIIVLLITTTLITGFLNAADAIISNDLAMGQLENDNTLFIMMEMYNHTFRTTMNAILLSIYIWNIGSMIFNTCAFIQTKYKERKNNEKL